MTQRPTVRSTYSYCIAAPPGRSPADLLFIHPFIYLLLDFIRPRAHSSLTPLLFFPSANTTSPLAAPLIEVSPLRDLAVNS